MYIPISLVVDHNLLCLLLTHLSIYYSQPLSHLAFSYLLMNLAQICIPSWPWFNRNPLPWQKPASAAATATTNDKKDKNSTSSSIEMKPLTKSD